jgi:hypothetical protein
LAKLALQAQQSEKLEGLLHILKNRWVILGSRGERREPVRRIRVFDSRSEGEHPRRIHYGTSAKELEIKLILVLSAALQNKIAKESQRRLAAG